jgi:RNA polymerase sigma-70 factor, ECF subfamily
LRKLDPQSLPKHVDRLYRAAWALCGSKEDAEDLVQETFARVLSRPRVLRGDDELYYLMRVLRNTFLTGRRTASRRPITAATLDDIAPADHRPTAQPERALEVSELYSTIAGLPEDFRLALVAVDVLGLSYREAGDALGAREATITTRLFRARKQVAERLGEAVPARRAAQDSRVSAGDRGPGIAGDDAPVPPQLPAGRKQPGGRSAKPDLGVEGKGSNGVFTRGGTP